MTDKKYSFTTFSRITEPAGAKVVYIHGGHENREEIFEKIDGSNFALVFIDGLDWNADTTPWPAKGVFGGSDFGGKAKDYLKILEDEIIPGAEKSLGLTNPAKATAGYSLGGLLSIYALIETELFIGAASVSGSLWYDGFVDFVKENTEKIKADRVYFSLGDKERKTKNPRMATVQQATEEIHSVFKALCPHSIFELNPGNHFVDAEKRLAAGVNYILSEE